MWIRGLEEGLFPKMWVTKSFSLICIFAFWPMFSWPWVFFNGLEEGSNEPMYKKGWLLICTDFDWILVFFGVYHTLKKPSLRIFAENISGTGNSKYGKWGWNLHFQKHHIFYLWFCSDLIFLVFWFLYFLCKFGIPRKHRTKKIAEKVAKNDMLKKKMSMLRIINSLALFFFCWSHRRSMEQGIELH